MPELPEVERERRLAAETLAGRRITSVEAADDPIVYEHVEPKKLAKHLKGRTVLAAHRHGKYLWLELDEKPWPLLHFGMTGRLRRVEPDAQAPRFVKLDIHTEDGHRLVMTNARRLGRIRLVHDPLHEPPLNRLGPDPLHDLPRSPQLMTMLQRRNAPLKAVLLDQTVMAGVGNWIADEVCYQARIHPARRANTLTSEEVARLRNKLSHIVRKAVEANADDSRFPRNWLFHTRWGKQNGAKTRRGQAIQFDIIGGRTTAWVPDVQPEP